MTPDELDLLHGYLNGAIGEADFTRLQSLLRESAEARRVLRDLSTVDAKLQDLAATNPSTLRLLAAPSARPVKSSRSKTWSGWLFWRPLATAAAAVALTLAVQHLIRPAGQTPRFQAGSPESIATLLLAEDCRWQGAKTFAEGQRLTVQTLRLERGLAVLRFDGGAAAILTGNAELKLQSRGSAVLHNGEVVVRAPGEAAGFILQTPASEVVDLGTEFAVKVERSGATEIHVLEGEVAYRKPNSGGGNDRETAGPLLNAGQAVRYDRADAATPRPTGLSSPRFDELIRAAKLGAREDLLLAHEGFNYPVGSLSLKNANGDIGWADSWRIGYQMKLAPGDAGDLDIVTERLNQQWPVEGGHITALRAKPGFSSRTRPLAQPVRLDVDRVYYVSLLARQDLSESPSGQAGPPSEMRFVLRSLTNFFGDHVIFRLPTSGRPQIEVRDGQNFTSPLTVAQGRAQLWIGKIVARKKGEDEMFFRIHQEGESFDLMEPAQWSVQTRGIRSDAHLDLVALTVSGPGTCWFDEIRIGTNWRAVVPPQTFARSEK